MNALPIAVKGWCPGALRPMPTGDGLLARVRASAGRLSLDQAEALAVCARDHGNGVIEISSRANLQLRGVRDSALAELQARLMAVGLLDADPEVERRRNIVASPLGDLDPEAILDVGPVVAALETRLTTDANLRELPGKFGFLIDAGGRWPLGGVDADVRFEAFATPEGPRFAVRLGAGPTAACAVGEVPDVAASLARAFLELAGRADDAPRRMRGLTRRDGVAAVFAAAARYARHCEQSEAIRTRGLQPRPSLDGFAVARNDGLDVMSLVDGNGAGRAHDTVGILVLGDRVGLGVAPPFGRMRAEALGELARFARSERASGVRLTPWRTLVVVGLEPSPARRLAEKLEALAFIVTPDDPRLGVVACPGAPACAHAMSDTQSDARRLAAALPREGRVLLHVSGCAKGCARAAPAPLTLVATPRGYDLVLDGRAGDTPAHRDLTLEEAEALVTKHSGGLAA